MLEKVLQIWLLSIFAYLNNVTNKTQYGSSRPSVLFILNLFLGVFPKTLALGHWSIIAKQTIPAWLTNPLFLLVQGFQFDSCLRLSIFNWTTQFLLLEMSSFLPSCFLQTVVHCLLQVFYLLCRFTVFLPELPGVNYHSIHNPVPFVRQTCTLRQDPIHFSSLTIATIHLLDLQTRANPLSPHGALYFFLLMLPIIIFHTIIVFSLLFSSASLIFSKMPRGLLESIWQEKVWNTAGQVEKRLRWNRNKPKKRKFWAISPIYQPFEQASE